ncbi:hypothetical protein ZIOFF_011139 [Zingiber officinale]|uniref:Uncharacterized protein n=1 Tax=Zingiber officinale TaxID=94328 RepID=A0A8J5LZ91_ZINOF|nr:hypothetical protein ZIOFF_011139 [Zingiber officinale]
MICAMAKQEIACLMQWSRGSLKEKSGSWKCSSELPPPPPMGWLRSLYSPFKRLWFRLHSAHRKKRGIYILYEDVKSCQCEDVQVLWSILVESHSPSLHLRR